MKMAWLPLGCLLGLVLSLGGVAVAQDGFVWDDADLIEQTDFRESVTGNIAAFSDDGCDPCLASTAESDQWHLLPDGLLWQSYLAGPHEPRISTVIFGDNDDGVFWDATLGGRVGLLRYGTGQADGASGWQWDLEGAVITRLDLLHAEDVESMDYRFGTEITWAEGPWAMKFGYFHISSHVGDEYLIRNPTFTRINYVTESWIAGGSYRPRDDIRLYGEFANAFRASGGAARYQFQTGAEYTPIAKVTRRGAPFAAVNLNFREAVDYDVSTTLQAGWSFQSPKSGRRIRFGAQYGDGPTSQFSFFQNRESYLGLGVWFDY
ncbi:DUF1207 domain-containing protein [Crateriforma conspicua]|uniref:DUF1207 domain-containing protein n=1 Tax=Crateriforma conspicua TaxID=2527996 RepID=A0A5C5Y726_9PLAN|nr:DUF1207 domain-containing protein [Crateriforma conspicua]TWT71466.1 hypothetical protein Pan14r_37760 [Crateriforma conspicua]